MADRTAISYVDASWSPVAGCTPVSAGCAHCFAARYAKRKIGAFAVDERDDHAGITSHPFSEVQCREDQLAVPLGWRKPRTILVPTLGDLFHPNVPDEFVDRVFAVMALCPQHRCLVLTKRADWLSSYMLALDRAIRLPTEPCPRWKSEAERILADRGDTTTVVSSEWPLPNVWLGVSVEDQPNAHRIVDLINTPAAHHWISYEPALGPLQIPPEWLRRLSLCVVGGETGPGARPCRAEWIQSVIEQCRAASVPVWVKQLGTVLNKERLRDYESDHRLRRLLVQERP